jgi:menaquinol-cytochrome c reductase iron-sulfur subunit
VNTDTKPSEAGEFPTLPQAPTLPAPDAQMLRRRKFLNWLCIGVGSVSLASIFWAVVGFMLAPLKSEGKSLWRNVGKVEDFKIGSTTIVKLEDSSTVPWAGYAGQTAAWLRRDGESSFTCFSINCTHLGCPVRWIDTAQLFMCPCHGGVYYQDGSVAAGPPPQPLPQYKVRVRTDSVEVLASPLPIKRGVS